MINISLNPEYVLSVGGLLLTNTFLTSIIVTVFLGLFSIIFYFRKNSHGSIVINGVRVLVFELLKLTDMVTQDRELSKKILPLVATFFFFIITANLIAFIPGFLGSFFIQTPAGEFPVLRSPNSDLTTTLALALFSVFSIQFFSLKTLGLKRYMGRFFNFSGPVAFILGFFEMISEGVKIISFSFHKFFQEYLKYYPQISYSSHY